MTATDTAGTIVLTGPTGGLGRALLEPVARRQPEHLILLGRSVGALTGAARQAARAGVRAVSVVDVDLSDLAAVAAAGQRITDLARTAGAPVTALLLNAGVQATDRRHISVQGLELTFAVNVVAPHLLLRTTLAATAPGAHAVLVSSGTHFGDWHSYAMVPKPRWQDPALLARPDSDNVPADRAAGGRAYATSKLAVVHLAHAWAARHGDQLRVNAFDPGLMPGTGLARGLTGAPLWAWNHAMPALTFLPGWSTPLLSARHLAALAFGETYPDLAGGYVEIDRVRRAAAESYDPAREDRLWQVLEDLTAPHMPAPTVDHGRSGST